jgi:CheY-like chemotaxis protein
MKKLNILISEDDSSSRRLLQQYVACVADALYVTKNGKEAVYLFNNVKHIDLVIMDLRMPVMCGFSAIRNIREKDRDVTIIAQTVYYQPADKQLAYDAGCDYYIMKPFKKECLLNTIAAAFPCFQIAVKPSLILGC